MRNEINVRSPHGIASRILIVRPYEEDLPLINSYEYGPMTSEMPVFQFDPTKLGCSLEGGNLKCGPLAVLSILNSMAIKKSPNPINPDGILSHVFRDDVGAIREACKLERFPASHAVPARMALFDINHPRGNSGDRALRVAYRDWTPDASHWPYYPMVQQ